RVSLITSDDSIEPLKLFHFVHRNVEFLNFKAARVFQNVAVRFRFAVITGEAVIKVNRQRQVIHLVARRHFDFDGVRIAFRTFEDNWKMSRLFGFQQAAAANAYHPRTNDQKISSCLRVALREKGIFVSEWLADLFEINERQFGESEICQGSRKKRL